MSGSDLLRASTHKQSSHGKNEFVSVTVRKEDPKEKAGIRLEAEATGRVRVVNIAKNGLFANSDVEIGDIVLSINGKRLQKGEGPEELIEVIARAKSKVTVVVKKTNVKQTVPEVTPRDPPNCEITTSHKLTHFTWVNQDIMRMEVWLSSHPSRQKLPRRKRKV